MRARNIKPGFFKNEQLADLPYDARILFIGLWCLADREGRLEDRPKRIEAEIFPYETCDVEKHLHALASIKPSFIVRYEKESIRYIQIVNFSKHQSPNPHEKKSVIPPCKCNAYAKNSNAPLNPSSLNPSLLIPDTTTTPANPADRQVGALIKRFYELAEVRLGEKPAAFNGGMAGAFLKRRLKHDPPDDITHRIENFFQSTDPFIESTGWSFELFIKRFNVLKGGPIHAYRNTSGREFIGPEAPASKYAALTVNRINAESHPNGS